MKKILLAFGLLLSLGAGCMPGTTHQAVVDGKWQLAFTMPEGWTMVKPYDVDTKADVNTNVTHNDGSVYLQSTDKKVCYQATCPEGSVKISDGAVLVESTKLDSHRVLPEEREVLGNRLSQVKLCDDGGDCTKNGKGNYDYFLETDSGNFKFSYYGDRSTAEKVIKSAQLVTNFTDSPAAPNVDVTTK
jgi:hypothetical protein